MYSCEVSTSTLQRYVSFQYKQIIFKINFKTKLVKEWKVQFMNAVHKLVYAESKYKPLMKTMTRCNLRACLNFPL